MSLFGLISYLFTIYVRDQYTLEYPGNSGYDIIEATLKSFLDELNTRSMNDYSKDVRTLRESLVEEIANRVSDDGYEGTLSDTIDCTKRNFNRALQDLAAKKEVIDFFNECIDEAEIRLASGGE
jgi:glutamyl-tRNA reductase